MKIRPEAAREDRQILPAPLPMRKKRRQEPAAEPEPEPEPVPEILVFTRDLKYIPASVKYRKELEEKGIMTENSVFDTLEETLEYAGKRGISRVHLVGEKIEEYQVEKGTGEDETN